MNNTTGVPILDNKTSALAKSYFKSYYTKVEDLAPSAIETREFGCGDFEKKIAFRHLSFKNGDDLKKYVIANTPPFISYSSAEYKLPEARPMENKIWQGCELIFDLDATDLTLDCQKLHGRSWVCENCLTAVKDETIRLIEDYLVPDFGFSEKEIKINFSGNRGYHVHVANEKVFSLDVYARRQLSDYISGVNINPESFFPTLDKRGVLHGPKPTDFGWGGKFAKGIIRALNSGEAALEELGIEKAVAKRLVASRAEIILGITVGNWDKVKIPKKGDFWRKVVGNMAIKQSDNIDKNVTNDTHHLIRLPNSIHGDTGLIAIKIPSLAALAKFNPMKDAIVFRHKPIAIHVQKADKFFMNDEEFGPYENKDTELPAYAAMYLLLKRVATLK